VAAFVFQHSDRFVGVSSDPQQLAIWLAVSLTFAVGTAVSAAYQKHDTEIQRKRVESFFTGGDSFVFLKIPTALVVFGRMAQSYLIKMGEFPPYDVRLRVCDLRAQPAIFAHHRVGDVSGGSIADFGAPVTEGPLVGPIPEDSCYRVFFTARNGAWIQELIMKKSAKTPGVAAVTRVMTGALQVPKAILYEKDLGYEAEFGYPKWEA